MYKLLIFLGILIVFKLFLPQIKGWLGEKTVALFLMNLPKEKYCVIHDVMLPSKAGTTQIDHIVISIYGIFVIETKNYSGWITGNDNSEQWIKNMYGKKYSFRNPIKQNYGHVKALETLLELPFDSFIPIVVFSIDSTLKVKTNHKVVYTINLRRVIKSYTDVKFEKNDIERFKTKIIEANITSDRKEHVKNIHANIRRDKEMIQSFVCPKCGGNLVIRTGKHGTFLGCSNYPKCRFTTDENIIR